MQFVKADACGNDFLIVEGKADAALAIALCQRHTGVGADGVEFLEKTGPHSGTIRLVNADGSIAEISGNGTRCVAAWMAHESHARPRACRVVSADGAKFLMATGMGVPTVRHGMVKLPQGITVEGSVVHTGNPHFVIEVQSGDFTVQGHDWREIGKAICFHPDFPAQTNVEFVHFIDTNTVAIRIYERGVGPATSSGTGTCASAAATIAAARAASPLRVIAEGGEQRVEWAGQGAEITLTGPAELICQGEAFVG